MKFLQTILALLAIVSGEQLCENQTEPMNSCIQFTVSSGTGCAWMCSYCDEQLGTNNYYFTDGVCTYQLGGCMGNPVAGKEYTCCSA